MKTGFFWVKLLVRTFRQNLFFPTPSISEIKVLRYHSTKYIGKQQLKNIEENQPFPKLPQYLLLFSVKMLYMYSPQIQLNIRVTHVFPCDELEQQLTWLWGWTSPHAFEQCFCMELQQSEQEKSAGMGPSISHYGK